MNFFNRKTTWSNIELGLMKICLISFGIVAGLYFFQSLKAYFWEFLGVFAITCVLVLYLWIKKSKQEE